MRIRTAELNDADGISDVLVALVRVGAREKRADAEFAVAHYIAHPDQIRCSIAEDAGRIVGFQSLKLAREANACDTPQGYGIIGTHIRPDWSRRGAGRYLFDMTHQAAREAGIPAIETCIHENNSAGLAFYAALGFVGYRRFQGSDCKRIWVG